MKNSIIFESKAQKPEIVSESIINDFKGLSLGEEITFNLDYDPEELHQQFENKYHGQFTWNYIDNGPGLWFISIVKSGKDATRVSDILAEHPGAFNVFRKYKIDVFCDSNTLFTDACREAGISVTQILKEIEEFEKDNEPSLRVAEWPLEFLIEYIVMNHHLFIKEKTKQIFTILRVLQNEGDEVDPYIFNINLKFINVQDALKKHIKNEETVVFPAIKKMISSGLPPKGLPFDSLKETILFFQKENKEVCNELAFIRLATKKLIVSDNNTNLKKMLEALEDFERDLHYHLHLENNILFPKAIYLEEEANIWSD